MSDDFGTVNLRRGDRAKEIEVLRKHRESLVNMLADVDQQLRELELNLPPDESLSSRPIVNTTSDYEETGTSPGGGLRVLIILGAALLALVLIAWLIWRASSDRPAATTTDTVVEGSTAVDATATAPAIIVEPAVNALVISPSSQDYGLVRKGTRGTRQYEIANNTEEPITIVLARSACRCLYYEHAPVIPPKAKESITVTVDGAKAKAGTLRETIRVSAKSDPTVGTSLDVIATVR